ncbi:MAG: hypothetical protein QXJ74_09295 [Nitrososphaera sp.]|uniref:hypothetical protein n=1 Tax=Nitrososphaera sp. TaxID=1971748 RepID=UPI0017F87AB5|nr:hypothetical protein [Nitrososphaera sp.]NWG36249.1 hypothetical protein [Nitrososphaera sp.]
MHFAKIVKGRQGTSLELYDSDLQKIESESFADLYTLNFHLQTLASKHGIQEALMVVHDTKSGRVDLALARGENSFFVS